MEFHFNVNEYLKKPIVEIGNTLLPPDFSGDRRALWVTVNKIAEVVNEMGEASAHAQGLNKPITTAERLRQSDQNLYLLVDQEGNGGNGAVAGMLKVGRKGLYVFDREGQHYQVTPPCVLDFYVHEKRQRSGLGKKLFEYMLEKEKIKPHNLAVDRPSEKFLNFLNKHYDLHSPIKQMNNYVVFDGFFPDSRKEEESQSCPKNRTNGLQSTNTPSYGRYGAPRPPCSMGQIIHNTSSQKNSEPTSSDIPTNSDREQQAQNRQQNAENQNHHHANTQNDIPAQQHTFSINNDHRQLQNPHVSNDYQKEQSSSPERNYQQQNENFSSQNNIRMHFSPEKNYQQHLHHSQAPNDDSHQQQVQNIYPERNYQQQDQNFPPQNIPHVQPQCYSPDIITNQQLQNSNAPNNYSSHQGQNYPNHGNYRHQHEQSSSTSSNLQNEMHYPPNSIHQSSYIPTQDGNQYYSNQLYQTNQIQQPLQEQIRMFPEREPQTNAPPTGHPNVEQQSFNQEYIIRNERYWPVQPQTQHFYQMNSSPYIQQPSSYQQSQPTKNTQFENIPTAQASMIEATPQYRASLSEQPDYHQPHPQIQNQGMYHQVQYPQEYIVHQQFIPQTPQISAPQSPPQVAVPEANIHHQMSQQGYYEYPPSQQIVTPAKSMHQEPLVPNIPLERQYKSTTSESKVEKYEQNTMKSDTVQSLMQVDPKYFKPDPIQIKQPVSIEELPAFPGKTFKQQDTVASLMGAEQEFFENGYLRDKFRIPVQREEKSSHDLSPDHMKYCPHHHMQRERFTSPGHQVNQIQPIQLNRPPLNIPKQLHYQEPQCINHQAYTSASQTRQQHQPSQQEYQGQQAPAQYATHIIPTEKYKISEQSAGNQQINTEVQHMDNTSSAQERLQTQVPQVQEGHSGKRHVISQYHADTSENQPIKTPKLDNQMEESIESTRSSKTGQPRFPTTIRQNSNNPTDLNTYAEGPERALSPPRIEAPQPGADETKSSERKKIIGQYGLNDVDMRRKVYKSAILKKPTVAQETSNLEYGYPPQLGKNVTTTKVVEESVNNSPKLERPKSLEIQTENSVQELVKEVTEVVENDIQEEIIEPEIEKLQITEVLTALPPDQETVDGKKTPRHLTEQGYFDLKFYHNKLW